MLAMELALMPLGGFWLDRQFGTTPWLTFVGVALGLLIASLDFYRLTKTQFGTSKRENPGDSKRRSNG